MAVPAAPMSITPGMSRRAAAITRVSSQSDRLAGSIVLPASAWIMSARLQMLLDAGRFMVVSIRLGACIVYCIVCISLGYICC